MLIIRTSGDSFDRGVQQGRVVKALSAPWFERTLAEERQKIPASQLAEEVTRLRQRLERVYPQGYRECCGIASGMDIPEDEYFAVAFSFLLLSKLVACTTLGFRNSDLQPMFCKTDDLGLNESQLNVMEITDPQEGYWHVHFHLGGTIWTIAGMNDQGLAIGMTAIPGPMLDEDGFFSLDALHTILPHCANVAEVESHLQQLPVSYYGFSLMCADSKGSLALFEKTHAGLIRLLEQSDGFYLHTNHILDQDFAMHNPAQYEPVKTNGEQRFTNAVQLLQSLPKSSEGLTQFLSNRSHTGPICQRGEDGLYSSLRLIFDPFRKRIVVWPGYQDEVEQVTVEVDGLWRKDQ